jgi:hypothetical protein
MFVFYGTIQTNTINLGGEMHDDTLIDLTKNNPEQNAGALPNQSVGPSKPTKSMPVLTPKKSKWWVWTLVVIVIIGLGGGGYYLYKTQILSGKYQTSQFKKGPSLPVAIQDSQKIFGYFPIDNAIIYQKADFNIYKIFSDFKNDEEKILETFGGRLISLSSDGKNAILFYTENPVITSTDNEEIQKIKGNLKEAAGNYYFVNFENNGIFSLGTELSNFIWTNDNLYFLRGGNEFWTYDMRLANYQSPVYQGDIISYYKVTDLKYPIISAINRPDSSLIYFIVINSEANPSRSELSSFDTKDKKFTKIMDTNAQSLSFSPSGRYLALLNEPNRQSTIIKIEDKQTLATISDEEIIPSKMVWLFDDQSEEKEIVLFAKKDLIGLSSNTDGTSTIKNYYDLLRFNITTSQKEIWLNGKSNNIINPLNFEYLSLQKKVYFTTEQNNKIYELEVK